MKRDWMRLVSERSSNALPNKIEATVCRGGPNRRQASHLVLMRSARSIVGLRFKRNRSLGAGYPNQTEYTYDKETHRHPCAYRGNMPRVRGMESDLYAIHHGADCERQPYAAV